MSSLGNVAELSSRTGFSQSNPKLNLPNLLELTPDTFFQDTPIPAQGNLSPTLLNIELDITRISNRILVMGRCWPHRTDKEAHRNNIDELCLFLNSKYYPLINVLTLILNIDMAKII